MIGKWSTNNAMVPKSYEDFLTLNLYCGQNSEQRCVPGRRSSRPRSPGQSSASMTTWARSVGDPPSDNDAEDEDNVPLAFVKCAGKRKNAGKSVIF